MMPRYPLFQLQFVQLQDFPSSAIKKNCKYSCSPLFHSAGTRWYIIILRIVSRALGTSRRGDPILGRVRLRILVVVVVVGIILLLLIIIIIIMIIIIIIILISMLSSILITDNADPVLGRVRQHPWHHGAQADHVHLVVLNHLITSYLNIP